MPANPAHGAVERKKKTKRAQDDRQEFNDETLQRIFAAPWFKTGKGVKALGGTYWNFQPHHYWLPLLALMAGGRLNELSQLHLSDVRCTATGNWYLDFNLDGTDKIAEPDKRLKTVNSIRQVPLHPLFIRLGLIGYVEALRKAGQVRLFPELRFDRVKGYGKQAGQWFNEKYLGEHLKIPRDGKQTFHSFRHNLVTALGRLEPPLSEFIVNQLSGHERGETMSGNRYTKDLGPDALSVHLAKLNFNLPTIGEFDITEGIQSLRDALRRKKKLPGAL